MDAPGVEVRPIQNMAGDKHFAEIFFTDVQVPVENRLGAEGEGWKVTVSALANERSSIGEVTQLQAKLDDLKMLVKQQAPRQACQRRPQGSAHRGQLRDQNFRHEI